MTVLTTNGCVCRSMCSVYLTCVDLGLSCWGTRSRFKVTVSGMAVGVKVSSALVVLGNMMWDLMVVRVSMTIMSIVAIV